MNQAPLSKSLKNLGDGIQQEDRHIVSYIYLITTIMGRNNKMSFPFNANANLINTCRY